MAIKSVCVLGGSGFVGREIVRLLTAQGISVRVPTRSAEKARKFLGVFAPEIVQIDVHDAWQLAKAISGTDAVINLVGILHETPGQTFRGTHVDLTRKVIDAAAVAGVPRLLHMSALNAASDARSGYLRSKGEGELLVLASDLKATMFRPSVIFGAGDRFINLFGELAKWAPVLPLACADAKLQPVWVEDVAQAFLHSLNDDTTIGHRYDLCGPWVYTLRELVAYAAKLHGKTPLIIPLPRTVSYLQARMLELLPVKLMTRDNYYSLQQDSICNCLFPFGITPSRLEDIAPQYTGGAQGR